MLGEASALFFRPKDKKIHADSARARFTVKEGGDHLTLLKIFEEWQASDYSLIWSKENYLQQRSLTRARDVRDQLVKLCERVEVSMSACGSADYITILKALTSGYFSNCVKLARSGDYYQNVKTGQSVYVHPSSVVMANTRVSREGGEHDRGHERVYIYITFSEADRSSLRISIALRVSAFVDLTHARALDLMLVSTLFSFALVCLMPLYDFCGSFYRLAFPA
jgi:HrpA-like RNA helicase